MMDAYITKYALTQGIYLARGRKGISEKTFIQVSDGANSFDQYFHGKDFHTTAEDAISRAEEMRTEKLKSLDKQVNKIR